MIIGGESARKKNSIGSGRGENDKTHYINVSNGLKLCN